MKNIYRQIRKRNNPNMKKNKNQQQYKSEIMTESLTGIIIQARMTSTRLPGKVLKPVYLDEQPKTMLEAVIERVAQCQNIDMIIVATTTNKTDDPIEKLCRRMDVECFRGDEHDVLERYYLAATRFDLTYVIRITSDCPVIDPEVIDQIVTFYKDSYPRYDYVSNTLERTYPRGLDTEIFSYQVLRQAYLEAKAEDEREHVTCYIYRNSDNKFRIQTFLQSNDYSDLRLTVDTVDDLNLIQNIYEALYPNNPNFRQKDIVHLLTEVHPEWVDINSHIGMKFYSENTFREKVIN